MEIPSDGSISGRGVKWKLNDTFYITNVNKLLQNGVYEVDGG